LFFTGSMHRAHRHPGRPRLLVALLLPALLALPGCPGLMQTPTTIQTSHGEAKALLGEAGLLPALPRRRRDDGAERRDARRRRRPPRRAPRRPGARALLVDQMAFHHVAQGELGDAPFAVMYCVVCDVAMGLDPVVDGALLHLSAGGLSNGVMLARDDETGSYWEITGEAVAGPLAGKRMSTWPIERTNVRAARLEEPTLPLARAPPTAATASGGAASSRR
jgi:hypothetical protein